jgi:hypothetical protein
VLIALAVGTAVAVAVVTLGRHSQKPDAQLRQEAIDKLTDPYDNLSPNSFACGGPGEFTQPGIGSTPTV